MNRPAATAAIDEVPVTEDVLRRLRETGGL
jgi:hypothetical protein